MINIYSNQFLKKERKEKNKSKIEKENFSLTRLNNKEEFASKQNQLFGPGVQKLVIIEMEDKL